MQKEFNKNSGVVLNTYQCYLKGSIEHIASDLNHACEGGYYFGGKLVRGAYMVTERKLAAKNGCPSPIHDCKLDTDANYDRYGIVPRATRKVTMGIESIIKMLEVHCSTALGDGEQCNRG